MVKILLKFAIIALIPIEINSPFAPKTDSYENDCQYVLYQWLRCVAESDALDIKQQFLKLDNDLQADFQKMFPQFTWDANIVDGVLPEQVFNNFRLIQIDFSSENLERIHSNAFSGLKPGITGWRDSGEKRTKLRNFPNTDYDLYRALSSLGTQLVVLSINLDWDASHEIPDSAFIEPNSRYLIGLNSIAFSGQFRVSRLGNHVFFYLPNVREIAFRGIVIESIAENAFNFSSCQDCPVLSIHLNATQLSEDCLERGALDITRRTVALNLDDNEFRNIEEILFENFLENNRNNRISLNNNPLECSQKSKYEWILNRRLDYENRILGAKCSDGTTIWDHNWSSKPQSTSAPVLSCNTRGEYNGQYGVSEWPVVEAGEYSVVECANGEGEIRWKCLESGLFDESGPEMEDCWLEALLDNEIGSVEEAVETLETAVEKTANKSSLNSMSSLNKMMEIVVKIETYLQTNESGIESTVALNLTQNFVQLFSQLIDQKNAWSEGTSGQRCETAAQLLLYVQFTAFTSNCYLSPVVETKEFLSDNLGQKLFFNFTQQIVFELNSSSIVVPEGIGLEKSRDSCQTNSSLGALIRGLESHLTEGLADSQQTVNSAVIAFSSDNSNETRPLNEGQVVRVSLKHNNRLLLGDRVLCVFWDFTNSRWSEEGCRLVLKDSDRQFSVCECDHLTNFAAIMDLSGRETDGHAKNVVTQVFTSLSVVCLIVTIILITRKQSLDLLLRNRFLKKGLKKNGQKNQITERLMRKRDLIVVNLSASLLVADLLVMIGMDRTEVPALCKLVSVLLLYALLSSFVWMFLQGFHLFRMTYRVFETGIRNQVFLAIGYGTPLPIIIIGLLSVMSKERGFGEALVGSDYFCWISSPKEPNNVWILIGPALTVIVVNLLFVAYLLHQVLNMKSKIKGRQVFGFACLLLNLGISWSLFLLYMHRLSPAPEVFSYLFIVMNGSQGVFVLVYQLAIRLN